MHLARSIPPALYVQHARPIDAALDVELRYLTCMQGTTHDMARACAEARAPLNLGGMGLFTLGRADLAALACAASALAALVRASRDLSALPAWNGAPAPRYAWFTQMIEVFLDIENHLHGPMHADSVKGFIAEGWRVTQDISHRAGAIRDAEHRALYNRATTHNLDRNTEGDLVAIKYPLPQTFADMHSASVCLSAPRLQKSMLTHMYALEYVERAFDMSITPTDRNHIKCFAEKYSSATLVTVPSAPVFSLSRLEYQFHLRARLRLPCLLQPYPARPAHLVLGDEAVRTSIHDEARDGFALSAVLSDCVVRPEPLRHYIAPRRRALMLSLTSSSSCRVASASRRTSSRSVSRADT